MRSDNSFSVVLNCIGRNVSSTYKQGLTFTQIIVGLGHVILKPGVITYDLFLYVSWNFYAISHNKY